MILRQYACVYFALTLVAFSYNNGGSPQGSVMALSKVCEWHEVP